MSILDTIFRSMSPGEFKSAYFPDRLAVEHCQLSDFAQLAEDPRLLDVDTLISCSSGSSVICYGDDNGKRTMKEFAQTDAMQAYQDGWTCSIRAPHEAIPVVDEWRLALEAELNCPVMCEAIASPKGEAVPKHYDGVELINIQLKGEKQWTIAENDSVQFPYISFFPGLERNPRDGANGDQFIHDTGIAEQLSNEMPDFGTDTVTMLPGSALFLPRGYWHQTRCFSPSVSLVFVIKSLTSMDIALEALRHQLFRRPSLRRPVTVERQRYLREEMSNIARQQFDDLEKTLINVVGGPEADP